MMRGDTFTVADPVTGEPIDCEVLWAGARTDASLLARWPTQSSLQAASSISPAKGRKHVTPTPVSPKV